MLESFKVPKIFIDEHKDLPLPEVDTSITMTPCQSLTVTLLIRDTNPSGTYSSLKSSIMLLKKAADVENMPPLALPAPCRLVRPFSTTIDADLDDTGSTSFII